MNRIVRGATFSLGGLIALIGVSLAGVYGVSSSHMNRTYDIQTPTLTIPTDSASIARGAHTAILRGCVDCHGDNLAGSIFIDQQPMGRLVASNLSSGEGGIGRTYTDADLDRAIRHGVGPDGKPLLFMPSYEYNRMSDEDTADLIAYIRSIPAVDTDYPTSTVGPLGRLLYLKGDLPLLAAQMIDHSNLDRHNPTPGPTAEYGAYLAVSCTGCHGEGLSGGTIPGVPPNWPQAANITLHESGIAGWTEDDFMRALREGIRPDGSEINGEFMPIRLTKQATDDEIRAMWAYLQTVSPKPHGQR